MCVPQRFVNSLSLRALCLANLRLIEQFLLFASNNSSGTGSDTAAQQTPGLQHKQLPGMSGEAGLFNAVEQKLFIAVMPTEKLHTINTFSLRSTKKTFMLSKNITECLQRNFIVLK